VKALDTPRESARDLRVLLYEGEGARPLGDERRRELLGTLLDQGFAITRLGTGTVAPDDGAPLVVLADFASERAPDFAWSRGSVRVEPLAAEAGAVLARLCELRAELAPAPAKNWLPWFPVIDYQRCTNCMQCLSFCLFDVYGVDAAGKIEVRNEEKCKTNCPACSRVCPEIAILFPKYKKGPINGDVVRAEDVQKETVKVDISALLGGDIYASLRERFDVAKKRFSTERDESRALLERKRCLKELGKQLDIPDEVLMTLPSAGEIEERARRAREKLDARMARSQTVKDKRAPATEQEWGL
jgi:NAD-dependent dihydropyrimidine dehydrogenase PreA subunit